MKNQVLLILCGLIAGFSSFAQQDNSSAFSLQIAYDTVGLEEQFEIKYTLENVKALGQFQAPTLEGFQVLAGPMTGQSMSIINGNMTQSVSYTYIVKANALGIFTIPSASIETEEGFMVTEEQAIVVVKEVHRPQLNNPFNAFQDPFFNNSFFNDPFSNDPFFNQGSQERMDDMMKQFNEMFRMQPPSQYNPNQSPSKKPKKKEKVYKI